MKRMTTKLLSLLLIFAFSRVDAQVMSGAAFLRSLPGSRLQAMSSSATAGLDGIHSFYANPGTIGFMREFQWSAGYTKWIADVYNASLLCGQRVRMPWSKDTKVTLGVLYQGVEDFDSSDGATPMASASDVIINVGIGQPLTFISPWLSLGIQGKYFRSTLDQFNASALMFDAGLLYRTPNFNMPLNGLGIFEYGILSTGLSIVNVGSALEYISVETPLPRAVRAGIALNAGTHNGFQTQLAVDYLKYDNEDGAVNFGLELSWDKLIAIQTGYQKDIGLVNTYTFGLSLNLDDTRMPLNSPIPGRNKAVRLDVASLDEGEFFSRTYHGSVSHYTIGPESFELNFPAQDAVIEQDSLTLRWEKTKDPDLYDDVTYHLLVSQDSLLIANVLYKLEFDGIKASELPAQEGLLASEQKLGNAHKLENLAGGDYYWSVVAFDSDDHYKVSKLDDREISHFYIPLPDLLVEDINFEYHPWITTDEYQGKLQFVIRNAGHAPARNFYLFLHDSVTVEINNPPDHESWAHTGFQIIEEIAANSVDTLEIDWYRVTMGLARIAVTLDSENTIPELNEENNTYVEHFYTIPKGTFTTGDVTRILAFQKAITELPIINEVNFEKDAVDVQELYLQHKDFVPPLAIISERLMEDREIKISLKGFSDTNSENATVKLANDRSLAVKQKLLELGVSEDQITLKEGQVLARRGVPAKEEDARWIFEERRKVEIQIVHDPKNLLFEPVPEIDEGHFAYPLTFDSKIRAAIPAKQWGVHIGENADMFNYDLSTRNLESRIDVAWTQTDSVQFVSLMDKDVQYAIVLTDSLGRTFKSKPHLTKLAQEETNPEHRFSFPLKFDDTSLTYSSYWDRVFTYGEKYFQDPKVRLRFDGHACAIGRAAYNLTLSKKRAIALKAKYEKFLSDEKAADESKVRERLKEEANGFGEEKNFEVVRVIGDNKVIGDNEIPIGRKYNRRIEIIYYVPDGDKM